MRAIDEIKLKQREEYHRSVPLSTLNDTLDVRVWVRARTCVCLCVSLRA